MSRKKDNKPGEDIQVAERPTVDQLNDAIVQLERSRETKNAIKTALGLLLVFAAAAVLVATLWLPIYQVQQRSMEPTLREGDLLVFMTTGEIRRGDIVAFHYNNQIMIKRVIAVGGEWVDITPEGLVIIDGVPLDEPYLSDPAFGECGIELPYQVPVRRYFVMGDNRFASLDSRTVTIGAVSSEQISGKALIRIWPIPRFGTVG